MSFSGRGFGRGGGSSGTTSVRGSRSTTPFRLYEDNQEADSSEPQNVSATGGSARKGFSVQRTALADISNGGLREPETPMEAVKQRPSARARLSFGFSDVGLNSTMSLEASMQALSSIAMKLESAGSDQSQIDRPERTDEIEYCPRPPSGKSTHSKAKQPISIFDDYGVSIDQIASLRSRDPFALCGSPRATLDDVYPQRFAEMENLRPLVDAGKASTATTAQQPIKDEMSDDDYEDYEDYEDYDDFDGGWGGDPLADEFDELDFDPDDVWEDNDETNQVPPAARFQERSGDPVEQGRLYFLEPSEENTFWNDDDDDDDDGNGNDSGAGGNAQGSSGGQTSAELLQDGTRWAEAVESQRWELGHHAFRALPKKLWICLVEGNFLTHTRGFVASRSKRPPNTVWTNLREHVQDASELESVLGNGDDEWYRWRIPRNVNDWEFYHAAPSKTEKRQVKIQGPDAWIGFTKDTHDIQVDWVVPKPGKKKNGEEVEKIQSIRFVRCNGDMIVDIANQLYKEHDLRVFWSLWSGGDALSQIRLGTKLEELNLNGAGIDEIPVSFSKLTNIRFVSLQANDLSVLPEFIGCWSQLEYLDLSLNPGMLEFEINETSNFSLYLSSGFSSLPTSFTKLTKLRDLRLNVVPSLFLDVSHVVKSGKLVPSESKMHNIGCILAALTSLRRLDISRNSISELPPSWDNLKSITEIHFGDNTVYPEFYPSPLTTLKVEELDYDLDDPCLLYNNMHSFPLPLLTWTNISLINLNDAGLQEIPDGIGSLVHLKVLLLKENRLSTLPSSISALTKLECLVLEGNPLASLPDSFRPLKRLAVLQLQSYSDSTIGSYVGDNFKFVPSSDMFNESLARLPQSLFSSPALQRANLSGHSISHLFMEYL